MTNKLISDLTAFPAATTLALGADVLPMRDVSAGSTFKVTPERLRGSGWVSIKDYGATANGTANDTAALHSAIAALPLGGTVVIPPGDYRLNAVITQNNVHLVGSGSFGNSTGTSRIRPYDTDEPAITFGDGLTQYVGLGMSGLQFSGDSAQQGTFVQGCRDVLFQGCSWSNFLDYGLRIVGVDADRNTHNVDLIGCRWYGPASGNANCVVLYAAEDSYVTVVQVIGGYSQGPTAGTGHTWRFDAHATGTTLDLAFIGHWMQATSGRGIYMEPRGRIFSAGSRFEDPSEGVILKVNDTAKIPNLWFTGSAYMLGLYENSAAEQYDLNQVGGDLLSYGALLQNSILAGTAYFAELGEEIDADTPFATSDSSRLTINGRGKHLRLTAADGDGSKNVELTGPVVQYQSGTTSSIRMTNDSSGGNILHYNGSPEGVITAPAGSILFGTSGVFWKTTGSGNTGWSSALT